MRNVLDSILLRRDLHGLQQGMDAPSIGEALANGQAIDAPVEKKRGRKKKGENGLHKEIA